MTLLTLESLEALRPIKNPIDLNASFGGCMFETHGKELDFILATMATQPKTVWTIINNDGVLTFASGFHRVNRIGYILTELEAHIT